MSRRACLKLEAELELLNAATEHEDARPGYGARFLDSFDACVESIEESPFIFPEVDDGVRRALLTKFRYAVFFKVVDDADIDVLAVLHQHQDVDTWRDR